MSPGGVRIGAPALTTRGMKEPEFRQIAAFMDRAAQLAIKIQQGSGKMLKDFAIALEVRGPLLVEPDPPLESITCVAAVVVILLLGFGGFTSLTFGYYCFLALGFWTVRNVGRDNVARLSLPWGSPGNVRGSDRHGRVGSILSACRCDLLFARTVFWRTWWYLRCGVVYQSCARDFREDY